MNSMNCFGSTNSRSTCRGTCGSFAFSLFLALIAVLANPVFSVTVGVIGDQPNLSSLSDEEQAAYNWAKDNFDFLYLPINGIMDNPDVLQFADVIWWHHTNSPILPSAIQLQEVQAAFQDYFASGGGLLLSGFATKAVVPLGLEDTPPNQVVREPMETGEWGFGQVFAGHPVFAGFPDVFPIVSSGLSADNVISWWTNPNDFNGIWLADTEFRGNIVAMGEYRANGGRVIVIGTGAFEWDFGNQTNGNRGNLKNLTRNIFNYLDGPQPKPSNIAWFDFDEGGDFQVIEKVSGRKGAIILERAGAPERTIGVHGRAYRAEGWSSWADFNPGIVNNPSGELTVEGWIAVRSYPNEEDAGIISQSEAPRGFFLGLDPFGNWNFSAGSGGVWHSVSAPGKLPKYRWVHVAGVFHGGGLRLYQDGGLIAENNFGNPGFDPADNLPLLIGRRNGAGGFGPFPLGVFKGLVDEFRIYDRALTNEEIASISREPLIPEPRVLPNPDRYENDPHRPRFTPMPPDGWTNEPHGLVFWNGNYHIFYQANPNGLYLGSQQQWGHVWSPDLAHWNWAVEALFPTEFYERTGTWSGSTLNQGGGVASIYTSNADAQTVSIAFSPDPLLTTFGKILQNPVIGAGPPGAGPDLQGHRDPFVFQANGFTYIIVGGGFPDGGRAFLYRTTDPNLVAWEFRGDLFSAPPEVAGTMWEMPQFFEVAPGKWVLIISPLPDARPLYWMGRFENERFHPEQGPLLLDVGRGIPGIPEHNRFFMLSPQIDRTPDGRIWSVGVVTDDRVEGEAKAAGYVHGFSLPRILSLHPSGELLFQQPAQELEALRGEQFTITDRRIDSGETGLLDRIRATGVEMRAVVDRGSASSLILRVRSTPDGAIERTDVRFSWSSDVVLIDRSKSSLSGGVGRWNLLADHFIGEDEPIVLHVFVDQSMLTVFANNKTVMTTRIYPTREDANHLDIQVSGGDATIRRLDVWPLGGSGEVIPEPTPTPTPTSTPTPTPSPTPTPMINNIIQWIFF